MNMFKYIRLVVRFMKSNKTIQRTDTEPKNSYYFKRTIFHSNALNVFGKSLSFKLSSANVTTTTTTEKNIPPELYIKL